MTTLIDAPAATATTEPSTMCHTKEVVAEIGPAVKADVQEFRYMAEDYVVEHPLRVVGIAAGVGFLLGVLWSR